MDVIVFLFVYPENTYQHLIKKYFTSQFSCTMVTHFFLVEEKQTTRQKKKIFFWLHFLYSEHISQGQDVQ